MTQTVLIPDFCILLRINIVAYFVFRRTVSTVINKFRINELLPGIKKSGVLHPGVFFEILFMSPKFHVNVVVPPLAKSVSEPAQMKKQCLRRIRKCLEFGRTGYNVTHFKEWFSFGGFLHGLFLGKESNEWLVGPKNSKMFQGPSAVGLPLKPETFTLSQNVVS